jgi:Zn-dependent peptidase ImmA (M78 family)
MTLSFLLILLLFCNVQCDETKATSDEQPAAPLKKLDRGNFVLKFDLNDEMSPVYQARLNNNGVLTSVIKQLNDQFILPHDIVITFRNIGQQNAFYDYESKNISFGYEFVSAFESIFMKEYKSQQEALDATRNAVVFFLLHELGHALIDVYKIPINGNPEDIADNFSINLLTETEGISDAAIQGASLFQILTKYETEKQMQDLQVLDVHLLNPQRYHNIICKLYGSDPEKYKFLIDQGYLELTPTQDCAREYESMKKAWARDLDPWLK